MPKKYTNDSEHSEKIKPKRISRSVKLRRYASVYKSYVRKSEQSKISKSPRRPRKPRKQRDTPQRKSSNSSQKKHKRINKHIRHGRGHKYSSPKESKRKSLNAYQKFVQSESKKEKYKNIPGKQRLSVIAEEWKKLTKN